MGLMRFAVVHYQVALAFTMGFLACLLAIGMIMNGTPEDR